MTRAVLTLLAAALLAAPAAPPLAARLETCERERATFVGSMPALRGTEHMEMLFRLEARRRSGPWHELSAPTFGEWERSERRRAGFVYEKRVEGLDAGVRYRAVVRFRWLDAEGAVQRRARRTTAACRPRPPRPGRPGTTATLP